MKTTDFINIDPDSIIYNVNEEKRTISARVMNIKYAFPAESAADVAMAIHSICDVPDKVVAVAKCDVRDTFNVEKGKTIARLKLLRKIKKYELSCVRRLMKYYSRNYANAIAELKRYESAYDASVNNITSYIENESK